MLFCAAGDESRPILTGVYTIIKQRELTAVTADGFRLGHKVVALGAGVPGEFEWSAVIPANSLRMLLKLIDDPEAPVLIAFDQSREPGRVKFSGERFTFITHLLNGQYPNFEQIIPKPDSGDCVTVVALEAFKNAVHTITPYVDKVRWVKMEHGQPVKLFASRIDVGQSEVEMPALSSEGGTCPHAFNVDYLLPLGARAGEKITFRNRPDSESDPMVITIDETVKYVIMPMHLSR